MANGNILNIVTCSDDFKNVGWDGCKFDFKNVTSALLVPKAFRLTQAQLATDATIKAALQAATLLTQTSRVYPIHIFKGFTDSSVAPVYENLGYDNEKLVKRMKYKHSFRMDNGLFHHIKLQSFNNTDKYYVIYSDGKSLLGTMYYNTTTSEWEMGGIKPSMISAEDWKFDDGVGKSAEYMVRIDLADAKSINENVAVREIGFDISDEVKGLIDLELVAGTAAAAKVAYVKVYTKDNNVNVYDEFNGELDAIGVWDIRDNAGATVTPSVAAVAGTKEFSFTFVSAGTYTFTLASPATLAGAGIGGAPEVGYECSNTISIVVPT